MAKLTQSAITTARRAQQATRVNRTSSSDIELTGVKVGVGMMINDNATSEKHFIYLLSTTDIAFTKPLIKNVPEQNHLRFSKQLQEQTHEICNLVSSHMKENNLTSLILYSGNMKDIGLNIEDYKLFSVVYNDPKVRALRFTYKDAEANEVISEDEVDELIQMLG